MKKVVISTLAVLSVAIASAQQKSKSVFRYQVGLNATIDKSLVQRVIVFSQNRATLESKNNKLEPMLNYKFGYVTPNGRPRLNLENDITALVENQFLHQYKVFPAAIAGFENSPFLRKLQNRVIAGAGAGTYLVKNANHFGQFNLYGFYEQSNFDSSKYNGIRIMPSVKGRHSFSKNKFGFIYGASYALATNSTNDSRLRAFVKPYFKIAKKLDFNILYDIWFENRVETNQPKEISILNIGLTYSNN